MRLQCNDVDNLVRGMVKDFFGSSQKCRQIIRKSFKELEATFPGVDQQVAVLERELAEIRAQEKEVTKAFTVEKLSDPVYSNGLKEQIHEFTKEKQRIEVQIETTLKQ